MVHIADRLELGNRFNLFSKLDVCLLLIGLDWKVYRFLITISDE